MPAPIVRDVSVEIGRGGIDPGGAVLGEAWLSCYTGRGPGDPAQQCSVTVNYGPTTSYGSASVPSASGSFHRIPIPVTPGQVVHAQVVATTVPNTGATTLPDHAFTPTPGALVTPGPAVSAVAAGTITATGATITYTTPSAPNGSIRYGTVPFSARPTSQPGDPPTTIYPETGTQPRTAHSVALTGLTGATRYFYRVIQQDAQGNTTVSPLFSFVTA